MDDDMIDATEPGYIVLTRRLEAYADLRLSPSAAATTRMRTAVMNAAHRRAALMEADVTFDAAREPTSARAAERTTAASARTSWRRPVAAILAGTLTLAILAGTAYGARPGGPLYAARLWTEMTNLPAGLVARAEAEGDRLEQRIREAQQASTAGDVPGTEAALAAYATIVVEAANGSDGDPAASAALEVSITRHVVVLTLMVETLPTQARGAAVQALSSGHLALDDLERSNPGGGHATDPTPPGGPADPGAGNDPTGQPHPTPPAIAPGQTKDGTKGPNGGNGNGNGNGPPTAKPTRPPTAAPHRPTPPPPPASSSLDRAAGAAEVGL